MSSVRCLTEKRQYIFFCVCLTLLLSFTLYTPGVLAMGSHLVPESDYEEKLIQDVQTSYTHTGTQTQRHITEVL